MRLRGSKRDRTTNVPSRDAGRVGLNAITSASLHTAASGYNRNPRELSFSLTNTPTGRRAQSGSYHGGKDARAHSMLVPYRSEPLTIQPSARLQAGAPASWRDNYFLEFAPNVKQMVARSEMPNQQPLTKEQMLTEFWDDLGLNPFETPKKKVTKKDLTPQPWEVRERLRMMVCAHEDVIEDSIDNSKYPLLVKGEIDPSLRNKSARKRKRKEEIEFKDKKFVDKAKERLKGLETKASEPWKTVNKQVGKMYESTRHSYHRKVAPSRFYEKK